MAKKACSFKLKKAQAKSCLLRLPHEIHASA